MDQDATTQSRGYHHGDLRAALLQAAETLLEEGGVDRFTLRGAARRVGVSHAAPAHHFGDTKGLLTELATIGFEGLSRAMEEEAAARPDDRLAAIGLGYVRFAIERPALFGLMWRTDRLDRSSERFQKPARQAFQILKDTIGAVYEADGRSVADTPYETDVRLAWATVHGLGNLINAGHLARHDQRELTAVEPWVTEVVRRMAEAVRASPDRAAASGPAPAPSARSRSG